MSFIQGYYQECVKGNGGILLEFSLCIHLFAQQNHQNNCPDPNLIIAMLSTQGLK